MKTPTPADPFGHILPSVHEAVRKSDLLLELHDKLSSLSPGGFAFVTEFGKLRDAIAPHIGETRILFPEFTPHDEALHVAKLFQLADKLFGRTIYRALNASELFLLSCALYAHDWGMAVGSEEREYLQRGAPTGGPCDGFSPLPDESERLKAFIKVEGAQEKQDPHHTMIDDHHLRLYVRMTHARRSAARVRAHFHEFPAVGEAIAHLCEGHWHDFGTLDDPDRFPRAYEVCGETTHLLALALQLRLIDLFHITDDRTPFALWRFVSPSDCRSAEEWKKHRALHGVAVIEYPPGRAIKVQGFTEDDEVWAGLQDLHRYCGAQVRRTLDLSARHVPERYGLNFLNVEWAVPTGTLRPVDFRFSFDRAAMFRILSEDIYSSDHYVFLRELLQNSIDAIRTRGARHNDRAKSSLKKRLSHPTFDTTIYFSAEHHANGDIQLTCRDHGVGMDEHIVRNYFTVAGVSYYRSQEFSRQKLGFEPVSRFGIGILSCFMVSDTLTVKTYRDPDCGPPMAYADRQTPSAEGHQARRLSIKIPGVERQFIVNALTESFEVGTEITLNVRAAKIGKPESGHTRTIAASEPAFRRSLEVTEYLTKIAGFVEFPVCVEETWPGLDQPRRTLILHPDRDPKSEVELFGGDIAVHQLSRVYPWHLVSEPEYVQAAEQQFEADCFELNQILVERAYEGWVVFPKPTNEDWDFTNEEVRDGMRYSGRQILWRDRQTGHAAGKQIMWTVPEQHSEIKSFPRQSLLAVYRDGILLEEITTANLRRGVPSLPLPMIHVNLPSIGTPRTNLARTNLSAGDEKWDDELWTAVENHLASTRVASALVLPPAERFYQLGWIAAVYRIASPGIAKMVPKEKTMSVWLGTGGRLKIREGLLVCGESVPLFPREFHVCARYLAFLTWLQADAEGFHVGWVGPDSLVQDGDGLGAPLSAAWELTSQWVSRLLTPSGIQFLKPPQERNNPIIQQISMVLSVAEEELLQVVREIASDRVRLLSDPRIVDALQKAVSQPSQLTPIERALLAIVISMPTEKPALLPISFPSPYSAFCGTDDRDFNSLHPVGIAVWRCMAGLAIAEREGRLSRSVARLRDELVSSVVFSAFARPEWTDMPRVSPREFVTRLFKLVVENRILAEFIPPTLPTGAEWAPKMVSAAPPTPKEPLMVRFYDIGELQAPFGKLLT